jgi:hypothetical protein
MIDRVLGNKQLPANIRRDIVERTDGIPLFVEEMTKAVLEVEGESEARRTAAAIPSPALAVPASLHASLMARLDRLGPAKEVAQIGAAIGFPYALLAAVARKPEADLDRLSTVRVLTKDSPENRSFFGEGVKVAVEVVVDPQRQIDHFDDLGDDLRAAAEGARKWRMLLLSCSMGTVGSLPVKSWSSGMRR